jgi:predicted nucleic acid-binding protein
MVLVDSSVWIEYFRGSKAAAALDGLLDADRVCVNRYVLAELIPALATQRQAKIIALLREVSLLDSAPDWDDVIAMQTANIKNGINKVGLIDVMIAQQAIAHGAELWSFDKHFSLMAKHSKLRLWKDGRDGV